MILEDNEHWYSQDGELTKTICEQSEDSIKFDDSDCCACDEAKYNVSITTVYFEALYHERSCTV